MAEIKIAEFKKNIQQMIEYIDPSLQYGNYLKFLDLEKSIYNNITKLSDQVTKKDIDHFQKLQHGKIKLFSNQFRYENTIIKKTTNLLISLKIIKKIKLLEWDKTRQTWAEREGIISLLSTDRNLLNKQYADFMIKKIKSYMAHFNEPLSEHEYYDHSPLTLNFLKLFFDLENKYGYENSFGFEDISKTKYACRLHHLNKQDKYHSALLKYAVEKGYPFKINSPHINYQQVDEIPAWCYQDKRYVERFIELSVFHEDGCIRLELLTKPLFLKALIKVASQKKQTLLDKQFAIKDSVIGSCDYWKHKDQSLINKLPNIFSVLYEHDKKINNGKINISEDHLLFFINMGCVKDWLSVNLIKGKDFYNARRLGIDLCIKSSNYEEDGLTKREISKRLRAAFKNKKLKKHFINVIANHYYENDSVFLLSFIENIETKIFIICEKIIPETFMRSDVNKTNLIKNILGFEVPYLKKHKKALRSINSRDRKKVLDFLLASEKNIFNKAIITDCFGL